jgi:hypothetical protein
MNSIHRLGEGRYIGTYDVKIIFYEVRNAVVIWRLGIDICDFVIGYG